MGSALIAGSWEPRRGSERWTGQERGAGGTTATRQRLPPQEVCSRLPPLLTSFAGLRPLLLGSWINTLGGISAAVSGGPQLPALQHACTTSGFPAGCQSKALRTHIPGTLWLASIPTWGRSGGKDPLSLVQLLIKTFKYLQANQYPLLSRVLQVFT